MEMEQRTPLMAKKLWGIIRAILYMVKKGLSKTIPWLEFHMMLKVKRSTKLAGKAIGNLLLEHSTLTCRPNDIHTTFIPPIEYEFSCSSNTPIFHSKRKTLYRRSRNGNGNGRELTVTNVRKVFDILNNYETETVEPEKSPLTLLGFGKSPNVRRLRVTDSPFSVNETEEDSVQVDKAAEEFIKNFYKELRQQKSRGAVEPPSPLCYRNWGQVR